MKIRIKTDEIELEVEVPKITDTGSSYDDSRDNLITIVKEIINQAADKTKEIICQRQATN